MGPSTASAAASSVAPVQSSSRDARHRTRSAGRGWRVTREGKFFLLVTFGVGVAAVNTGNNLLYLMLGLMLSIVLLSGVMSDLVLIGLRVERRPPGRLFAGSPALVALAVSNRKRWLSSYSLELVAVAPGRQGRTAATVLKVHPGAVETVVHRTTPDRRGPGGLEPLRVVTRYPFGLIEKSIPAVPAADVLVYPALARPTPPWSPRTAGARSTEAGVDPRQRGTEVTGLRDYSAGDEARRIHWRRAAALGRLVVREQRAADAPRLTIVVDNRAPAEPDAAWARAFEQRVSAAAAVAADALARGYSVEVVAHGQRSPRVAHGGAPDALWRFLALVEAVRGVDGGPLAAPAVGGAVTFVAGSRA